MRIEDLIADLEPVEPHPALVAATVPTSAQVMKAAYVFGGLYPDVSHLGVVR
jgi:hypothetical protein